MNVYLPKKVFIFYNMKVLKMTKRLNIFVMEQFLYLQMKKTLILLKNSFLIPKTKDTQHFQK